VDASKKAIAKLIHSYICSARLNMRKLSNKVLTAGKLHEAFKRLTEKVDYFQSPAHSSSASLPALS
jgi:hypothetical protein